MPTHAEKKLLPWTPEQLYDLVAGIERYPEFLPWCIAARIRRREGDLIVADLVIGFRMIRERFTSNVKLDPAARRIDVAYIDGPFRHLRNPIYMAMNLLNLGTLLWRPSWITAVGLVLGAVFADQRARAEEELLLGHFGDQARDYVKRVRRFLPGVY